MSLSLKDDILKAVHDSQIQRDHDKLTRLQEELDTGKLVRVVTAQWKRTPTSNTLYCDACDKISESQLETKYCPECGAKMQTSGMLVNRQYDASNVTRQPKQQTRFMVKTLKNAKDCPLQVNGKCKLSQMDCAEYPFNLCSIFQQAYQLGKEAGYKEADAMNYYEGSGIGGFHDY